ncbi:hypothetical protein ACUXAV_004990 [Cupriavidus metallidurans]|uniref:hypothetical protein n=1 Tax=Cupriavidus TaxID=106589 RepID=UPI000A7F6DA1|nr:MULTISPECIES: hypothetical protein [Cupriavidus]MDE4922629.1 hypothetical protein [Cupriavidus metallidurans]GMG94733.1 hypothetical protein Cmtc_59530 [Cupriavidus sp. TKC]
MQSFIHLEDPAVQAAIISAVGSILTSAIAALCAAIIGRQISGRKRLQDKLLVAQDDIEFLLQVEKAHCVIHKERDQSSNKLIVRNAVRDKGFEYSGKFSPGKVAYNDGPGRRYSKA